MNKLKRDVKTAGGSFRKQTNHSFLAAAKEQNPNRSVQGTLFPRKIEKVEIGHQRIASFQTTKFSYHKGVKIVKMDGVKKKTARDNCRYRESREGLGCESKMNKTHDTMNYTHRQTQKELFIKKLQKNVLRTLSDGQF